MRKVIYILLITTLFISCDTNDNTCRKSRKANCRVSFFLDTINAETGALYKEKLIIDSLWVRGLGINKYIYNKKEKISEIILPLNKFNEKSVFEIKINTFVDTLAIVHKNLNEYLSLSCGTIRTYKIEDVSSTKHFIDSVLIRNKKVNTFNVEHLQIHHIK